MTTVGALANQNLVLQFLQQLQGQSQNLQAQISTGLKSQTYSGLGSSAGQLVNLQGQVAQGNSYIATIGSVQQRMQEMSTVLSSLQNLTQDFSANLPQGAYATTPTGIQAQAQQFLQEIGDLLNTNDGTRYLFSGSLTSTLPFDASGLPNPGNLTSSVNGAPPAGYYAGNDTVAQARVDNNLVVNYGVTGDNPAFENIIRAANFLANLPPGSPSATNSTDVANINAASNLLTQGIAGLEQIQGTMAGQTAELNTAQTNHQNFINLTQTTIGTIESADSATAITQLNQVETTLQASYSTIASLSQLSLVNYLK
jgi:flagellar hook-associated protein 3 FlgL